MARYIVRRLLLLVPVLLGVSTLVFLLIHMIPGDPVEVMLGEQAQEADKAALRHALGLDAPLATQYVRFLKGVATGDLGESLRTHRPVIETLLARFPATLELTVAAMLIALSIALPLGIVAAVRQRRIADHLSMSFAMLGVSMPSFWLGPLLILLFSLEIGWFPVAGREQWGAVVLPALTLGTGMSAILTRMVRSSLLEVIRADFVRCARAKGLPEPRVILRHALANALIPVVTVVGLQFGALLAGSIITETIFAWPGVGRLTIQAIQTRDYPLVQGCILWIAMGYVAVNLAVDLLYAWIDPRIRLGSAT